MTEHFLLVGAILLFVAVLAGKLAYRFNAPALLLFLSVGLFFGYDIISFESPEMTQFIGMISLCIILFSGGMDTKFSEIRPVIAEGVTLATFGVLMTALLLGGFVYFVAPLFGITLIPVGSTPGCDHILYRFGLGLLDSAYSPTGPQGASATTSRVGEWLE